MKRTELKRKKRLNPKGKMTSKKFQGQALQAAYKQQFNFCELTTWFRANFREWEINQTQLDLHHIIGGAGRKDYWGNFIRLCRSIHAFDDVHPVELKIACLAMKLRKGELNLEELNRCSIGRIEAWVERHKPEAKEFIPLWEELMGAFQ